MNKKSIGKWAIVVLLATAMILSLCVCSKKAAPAATSTPAASAPAATAPAATTPAQTATPAPAPAATTPAPAPAAAAPAPAPVVETPAPAPAPVAEPAPAPAPVVEAPAPVAEEPAPAPVAEEPAAPVVLYTGVIDTFGLNAEITACADCAVVTIPAYITAEDLLGAAEALVAAYPEASLVTYKYDGSTIELYYPECDAAYISAVISQLKGDLAWYIASVIGEPEAVVAEVPAVEEAPAKGLVIAEDGSVTDYYNYRGLIEAKVVLGNDYAVVEYPAEYIWTSDIEAAIAAAAAEFPTLVPYITYEIEPGTLKVYFPAEILGGLQYKLETLAYLDSAVTLYADAFFMEAPAATAEPVVAVAEVAAPAPAVETPAPVAEVAAPAPAVEAPLYAKTVSMYGFTSDVKAYAEHATVTIPSVVTEADLLDLAKAINEAYPAEASVLTYTFDGETVELFYPTSDAAFVKAAVDYLTDVELPYYVASVIAEPAEPVVAVAEAPATEVAAPAPAVETPAPAAEVAAPAPAVEEPVAVAEAPVAEAAPVEAPVAAVEAAPVAPVAPVTAATEAGKKIQMSVVVSAGYNNGELVLKAGDEFSYDKFALRGSFNYTKLTGVSLEAVGKYYITKNIYALAGVGLDSPSAPVFTLEAGLGAEFKLNSYLSVFGEAAYGYNLQAKKGGITGSIGAKVSF